MEELCKCKPLTFLAVHNSVGSGNPVNWTPAALAWEEADTLDPLLEPVQQTQGEVSGKTDKGHSRQQTQFSLRLVAVLFVAFSVAY